MKQVFMGGVAAGSVVNLRRMFVDGFQSSSNGTGVRVMVIPEDGVISNARFTTAVAPGVGQTRTFTLVVNEVDSALVAIMSGTNTEVTNTVNTVSVTAGQIIHLRYNESGGAANANAGRWAMEFEPTAANRAVWGSQCITLTSAAAARYFPVGCPTNNVYTTAVGGEVPWGIDATVNAFMVHLSAAPGVGRTRTFVLYKNGSVEASSTFTIAGTATDGSVTGLSIAFNRTDRFVLECVTTGGTPASSLISYGMSYTPDNDGEWSVSGEHGGNWVDGRYMAVPNGNNGDSVLESNHIVSGDSGTSYEFALSDPYLRVNAAPIGDRTFTLRHGGVSTAVDVTISGAAIDASGSGSETLGSGSYISWLMNTVGVVDAVGRTTWTFRAGPPRVASDAYAFIT